MRWMLLLLLFCMGCEAEGPRTKANHFVESYHVKLIVNGELISEWYSEGPVWKDAGWDCVFIDRQTKKLIRLHSKVPFKEGEGNVSAVVVTSMDNVVIEKPPYSSYY